VFGYESLLFDWSLFESADDSRFNVCVCCWSCTDWPVSVGSLLNGPRWTSVDDVSGWITLWRSTIISKDIFRLTNNAILTN
jgi:hypothetical protein